MKVYADFAGFNHSAQNVYTKERMSADFSFHAVTIYGYGIDAHTQTPYYLVKNRSASIVSCYPSFCFSYLLWLCYCLFISFTVISLFLLNSWGPKWGDHGFFRIRANTNECAVEEYVLFFAHENPAPYFIFDAADTIGSYYPINRIILIVTIWTCVIVGVVAVIFLSCLIYRQCRHDTRTIQNWFTILFYLFSISLNVTSSN